MPDAVRTGNVRRATIYDYDSGGGIKLPRKWRFGTEANMDPAGVVLDFAGNLYVADNGLHVVYKVTSSGNISVFAGTLLKSGYSGDGSLAVGAQLYAPAGLALDSAGNLYIAHSLNQRIRKVDTSGIIKTVAGGGVRSLSMGDGGQATLAALDEPTGVAVDSAGNIYMADFVGSRVRKVASDGTITTVAGSSQLAVTTNIGDGGPATSAFVYAPTGVAVDSAGNLYIADTGNNRIRKVSNGIITTVAGSGSGTYSGDNGPATQAGLSAPTGVAVDAQGNIYIADTKDLRVRMVTPDGTITTITGNGQLGSSGDGGPATEAKLSNLYKLALGPSGLIYVTDQGTGSALSDSRVRLLTPTTSITSPPSPPSIKDKDVISASAFGQFASIAPGSWIEIYGSNLATKTRGWAGSDFNGVNAPTSLDGTKVTIGGQATFFDYISPGQVNAQVPSNSDDMEVKNRLDSFLVALFLARIYAKTRRPACPILWLGWKPNDPSCSAN